jgi:hypothetical protein
VRLVQIRNDLRCKTQFCCPDKQQMSRIQWLSQVILPFNSPLSHFNCCCCCCCCRRRLYSQTYIYYRMSLLLLESLTSLKYSRSALMVGVDRDSGRNCLCRDCHSPQQKIRGHRLAKPQKPFMSRMETKI